MQFNMLRDPKSCRARRASDFHPLAGESRPRPRHVTSDFSILKSVFIDGTVPEELKDAETRGHGDAETPCVPSPRVPAYPRPRVLPSTGGLS
jgi:hypothetical protein